MRTPSLCSGRPSLSARRALLLVLFTASCSGSGALPADTLPAQWVGAQTLAVQQSSCGGDPLTGTPHPRLELTDSGGVLTGVYKDAEFRCGDQKLCAYVQDTEPTARVLVQPCDLRPTQVPRCDCLYQVTFTLPARTNRIAVAIYHRWDLYGATAAVEPTLVDTQPVAAPALRWYQTCGDPVCRPNDAGAGAADGGAAACTTEAAGDACTTSGATCDPGLGCGVLLRCADKDPRVQPGGCPISRRASKRDITYVDEAGLQALADQLRELRLARYRYRDAPAREHLGFILDDGAGGPAVDTARDQIDLYGYLSWTVGALQAQMKRLDAQERELAALRRRVARVPLAPAPISAPHPRVK